MTKTILITGASGGIGLQLIKPLTDAGYNLALHYFNNLEALEKVLDQVKPRTRVACFKADLTQEAEVENLIAMALDVFNAIEMVVNNAGVSKSAMTWKQSLEDWNLHLSANLTSTFLVCKHILPHMRENNFGRIINNSSVVAQTGVPGTTAYAASKAAIVGFSKSLAKEVASKNITVNVLSYGYMDAGMIDELSDEMQEQIKNQVPLKKFGDVSNIAESILYLAKEGTNYITAQTIHINGGLY